MQPDSLFSALSKTSIICRKGCAPRLKRQPTPLNSAKMDSSKILSLVDQLDDEIDDLEEALAPLIKTALSETTSKLPLLDKAKLYVLVTYAIESMLFCELGMPYLRAQVTNQYIAYLRLNGVKAREHPVFKELTRVKQYFDKIKNTQPPAPRTSTLDKAAAARFINPGLVRTIFFLCPSELD